MNGYNINWTAASSTLTAITMYRGDSYALDFTITNSITSAAVDLTGKTFELTVNSEQAPTTNANQKFQVAGVIVTAADGTLTFTPSSSDTDLTPGRYYFDIQMTEGTTVKTIHLSSFTIKQDINKS